MGAEIETITRRQSMMEGARGTWEQHWREIAERVLPRQDDFFGKRPDGEKRTLKVFDSTAIYALQRFAAIMESILTPRTQVWHKLKAKGILAEDDGGEVGEWFDEVNRRLYDARYSPRAAFASNAHEGYMSLGAFGTAAMFIASVPNSVLWYRMCHLAEIFFAENAAGRIDTVHRKFTMTARQVTQQFAKERLPQNFLERAAAKPDEDTCVLHCTYPNADPVYGREDMAGMPYHGTYVLPAFSVVAMEEGYTSWPWAISRYVTAPREVFGRSPAMDALPDIKTLNEAAKARLKSWHYAVDPGWLVADDGVLTRLNLRPGAINVGMVSSDGRPLALPLQTNAQLAIDQEITAGLRGGVNDAFLVSLFQILVDSPTMTATEVLERAQEKGTLITPVMGRQHSEFLGPMIERELDLMARAGMLPEPPDEIVQEIMNGRNVYEVEYVSPLSTAARAQEALGVVRTIESIMPLAQSQPQLLDMIDEDEALLVIAKANSVPNKVLRSSEEVDAIRKQRAQQQAMQAAVQAAQPVSGAIANISKAQQAMQPANAA